jgi:monoamine oxidase
VKYCISTVLVANFLIIAVLACSPQQHLHKNIMVPLLPAKSRRPISLEARKRKTMYWRLAGVIPIGFFLILLGFMQFQDDYHHAMLDPAIESKVLIIGAGAAGLTAAATLMDCNIDFLILEASNDIGGRIKKTDDFADHSIDLGPSFVYDPEWLEYIADKTKFSISTVPVDAKFRHKAGHWLMEDYTWYDFFADHVAPGPEKIVHNCKVEHIWHGRKGAQVSCGARKFVADSVIVTVPLSVLKDGDIAFHPPLEPSLVDEHPVISMVPGIKILLEFKWKFYPAYFEPINPKRRGRFGWNEFYDFSASNKDSKTNILAADYVGFQAEEFLERSDEDITQTVLQFLDEYMAEFFFVSENMASRNFVKARIFNWSKEPFIRGATIPDFECRDRCGAQNVNDGKLFLAGEAFPYMIDRQEVGWVHNSAMSGKDAARQIIELRKEEWQVPPEQLAVLSEQFAEIDSGKINSFVSSEDD